MNVEFVIKNLLDHYKPQLAGAAKKPSIPSRGSNGNLANSRTGSFIKPKPPPMLAEDVIENIVQDSRSIIMQQPVMLELTAPIKVCGDLHGQFIDLLRLFEMSGHPPQTKYLFLGDYVDRGSQGVETITLLLALKIRYPDKVYVLRGNHECAAINRQYGFYDECKRRYSIKLWKTFTDTFNCLPITAMVNEKILCCHGGLSPELYELCQLKKIVRPVEIPDAGLVCDLLWADPSEDIQGWNESDRGVSFTYGADIVERFVRRNELDLICRAHQVVEQGYQFFANRRLITVFSAPNYLAEFDNAGAVLNVDASLTCSFQILQPAACKTLG